MHSGKRCWAIDPPIRPARAGNGRLARADFAGLGWPNGAAAQWIRGRGAMADDLTWMAASEIRVLIGKGEVSSVEVTDHFLGRIEEFNPTLKAFRSLDVASARQQALQAEAAVRSGEDLGSLHGIPVSVKEHIAVAGHPPMGVGFPEPVSTRDALGYGGSGTPAQS
jgi:hypothetical protein